MHDEFRYYTRPVERCTNVTKGGEREKVERNLFILMYAPRERFRRYDVILVFYRIDDVSVRHDAYNGKRRRWSAELMHDFLCVRNVQCVYFDRTRCYSSRFALFSITGPPADLVPIFIISLLQCNDVLDYIFIFSSNEIGLSHTLVYFPATDPPVVQIFIFVFDFILIMQCDGASDYDASCSSNVIDARHTLVCFSMAVQILILIFGSKLSAQCNGALDDVATYSSNEIYAGHTLVCFSEIDPTLVRIFALDFFASGFAESKRNVPAFSFMKYIFSSDFCNQCKDSRATTMNDLIRSYSAGSLATTAILDKYKLSHILNSIHSSQRHIRFLTFFSRTDPTREIPETPVMDPNNTEVMELDVDYNSDLMSDGEVQTELDTINEDEGDELNETVIEGPANAKETDLATPKLQSVVVIPVTSNRSRNTVSKPSSSTNTDKKPNRNRNGSTKRKMSKKEVDSSAGSLVSMLSRVKVSNTTAEATTPINSKRIRSAGTTPENQPTKITKTVEGLNATEKSSYSLVVRRTLNLKICVSNRPPAGRDLFNIKQFLREKIEKALTDGAAFIPIFKEVCRIAQDGVYVFCADFTCAEWIANIVKEGIPAVNGQLTVLPQDTPLKLKPEMVMVRVVTCIPTKQPKEKILDNLTQMNKNLNTRSWDIKRIRPKGSSSMIFMRMDKKSFDFIVSQDSKINWILGPITIREEEHRAKPKPPNTGNSHLKPPPTGDVESYPKGSGLTRNGGSKPKGKNQHI